jgi:hypothetical protein
LPGLVPLLCGWLADKTAGESEGVEVRDEPEDRDEEEEEGRSV